MNAGNVFRAYDIRGVVDKDFNAEWVTHLGKACGTSLKWLVNVRNYKNV